MYSLISNSKRNKSKVERIHKFIRSINWVMILAGVAWLPTYILHNSILFSLINLFFLPISACISLFLIKKNKIVISRNFTFISLTIYFLTICILTEGSQDMTVENQQVHFWLLVLAFFSYFILYDIKPFFRDLIPASFLVLFFLFHFSLIPWGVLIQYPGVEKINIYTIFIALVTIYFLMRRFVIQILNTEEQLANKNIEITDSIKYASRIQYAILPSREEVQRKLGDSFVLYKPKDIVAGDFYWLDSVHNTILFAACDCTGHGVPGAMVSVVCHNSLNRAVREFGLTEPAAILDKVSELVLESFSKGGGEVHDGMDISICALNKNQNSLEWAGANSSLILVNQGKMTEYKGDKQCVGYNHKRKTFTNHKLSLSNETTIYLYSDGFPDQFGGDKNKKLTSKKFKELLLGVQSLSMDQQKIELDMFLARYRMNQEQTDDILVIGVKV